MVSSFIQRPYVDFKKAIKLSLSQLERKMETIESSPQSNTISSTDLWI